MASLGAASAGRASPIRTLLVGDSLTAGVVSEPTGPSFAELLSLGLSETHEVVNVGLGGTSAFYWAPSTPCTVFCEEDPLFEERAAPELPAQIATLLLGTNDAVAFFLEQRTPVEDWEQYMREIVDGLFAGGVHSVVLMSPPDANLGSAEAELLIHGYRERVLEICGDTPGVVCGPDLSLLLDPETDFQAGDLHPNAFGHAKIAAALTDSILALPEPGTGALLSLALAGSLALSSRRPRTAGRSPPGGRREHR